jgi:micrococcal nuclease
MNITHAGAGNPLLANPRRRSKIRRAWITMSAIVALAVASCGTGAEAEAEDGTVTRIIDGDTLEISYNSTVETIRLLNIDTPETKDPDEPVQCLGPEATEYLEETLPPGTKVKLAFDAQRTDQYGRTLAAVFTEQGTFINAEIARQGLGVPAVFDGNDRFLPEVEAAHAEAVTAQIGLYDETIGCTAPGQVAAVISALEAATAAPVGTTAAAGAATAAALAAAITAAQALESAAKAPVKAGEKFVWGALAGTAAAAKISSMGDAISKAKTRESEVNAEVTRLTTAEAEAAAAARAEAERVEAAKRAEAERIETDRIAAQQAAAAEAERLRNLPPAPAPKPYIPPAPAPAPAPKPAPYVAPDPAPANPYPGYTGPRCYAPGGKTWRPC